MPRASGPTTPSLALLTMRGAGLKEPVHVGASRSFSALRVAAMNCWVTVETDANALCTRAYIQCDVIWLAVVDFGCGRWLRVGQ
jgi:hypothetical protein